MITFKQGVYTDNFTYYVLDAINLAHNVIQSMNHDLVITSLADGQHMPNSLHYSGYAVDIRTRDLTKSEQQELKRRMEHLLGIRYDVILHDTHLHIEYDYEMHNPVS